MHAIIQVKITSLFISNASRMATDSSAGKRNTKISDRKRKYARNLSKVYIPYKAPKERERQREREGRIAAKWLKQSFPIFNGNVVHILFFI